MLSAAPASLPAQALHGATAPDLSPEVGRFSFAHLQIPRKTPRQLIRPKLADRRSVNKWTAI